MANHNTPTWEQRYMRGLTIIDTIVVVLAVMIAYFLSFGIDKEELFVGLDNRTTFAMQYTSVSVIITLGWLAALIIFDTRDPKRLTTGSTEYVRVINATFVTFGTVAIIGFSAKAQIGRGFLLIALPVGLLFLLLARFVWHHWIRTQRERGECSYRTLIIGHRAKSAHAAKEILADKYSGFQILGCITEGDSNEDVLPGIPMLGDYDSLVHHIDKLDIKKVIVTNADMLSPQQLKQIGWELEDRQIDLIVSASLTDIAGPRLHVHPVSGLPLIHVQYPRFTGHKYVLKRLFDIIGSTALITLLSPVFLVVALLVKFTSKGPVFYAQERIGIEGRPFKMFKFRSMITGADDLLKKLLEEQGTADKPLHKVDNDPRITPIGHFIRRYSLDELPQLFNVLIGTMSLVGPRPQREAEVELYLPHHHRRLLVKPGITGLWQVSGRSDLAWENTIRLDLYYVENWSLAGDIVLLWRTINAVVHPEGAR